MLKHLQGMPFPSQHQVYIHGEVSRPKMLEILMRAHILVNPHRMERGQVGTLFPFKIIEYLAAGVPVVTSRLGAMPEQVRKAITMYDSDNPQELAIAIQNVLAEYPRKKSAAVSVQHWVHENYSLEAVAKRIEKVLAEASKAQSN